MLINRLIFLIITIVLFGCSNLEFVYDYKENTKLFNGKTTVSTSGDDSDLLSSYIYSKLRPPKNNDSIYRLEIKSTKDVKASVIEKDATASKFSTKYNIRYKLKNNTNNCLLIDKKITTESFYDAKSSGYSFGTDVSEKERSIKNMQSNVDEFLRILAFEELNSNCL